MLRTCLIQIKQCKNKNLKTRKVVSGEEEDPKTIYYIKQIIEERDRRGGTLISR